MPIGNYLKNFTNITKIKAVDREYFVLSLLTDVIKGSSNTLLNTNTKVNFEGDSNLQDLDGVKMLLSFKGNKNDPRNVNLEYDKDNNVKMVYEIGAIVKKGEVTSADFMIAFQEIIDGLTANWNSNTAYSTNYIVTLPSGLKVGSPLTLNTSDTFPDIVIYQEDQSQVNYLTFNVNIVFIVDRMT